MHSLDIFELSYFQNINLPDISLTSLVSLKTNDFHIA
jgi:hypothetical protein